jgi:uncharacterized protein YbjT (DUF2867 family)
MKVIIFGATGMVGQGVLRECLLDPEVTGVLAIVRTATGQQHAKLTERIHTALLDLSAIENDLAGYDACFFCLGVSSVGLTEDNYRRLTYDLTLSIARTLIKLNPAMTFIYVSGMGTDSRGNGRLMWARVKGETENALLAMPFKAAYMFRPGYIQPTHGVVSKTKLYRVLYTVASPFFPIWRLLFPKYVATNEQVGRAMIEVALHGAPKPIIENKDINRIRRTNSR